MPTAPKKQKRPADVVSNAVHVMRLMTGEAQEEEKNPAAVALGRMGGEARAARLSKTKRKVIAQKAARARWSSKSK